jgi:ABC-type cobalamin transport system ATPase subunit
VDHPAGAQVRRGLAGTLAAVLKDEIVYLVGGQGGTPVGTCSRLQGVTSKAGSAALHGQQIDLWSEYIH